MTERPPLVPSHTTGFESPDPPITIHGRNTIVGSLCASALASTLALGAQMSGHPIEGVPTIDFSYTHTEYTLLQQNSITWRNQAELVDQTMEKSSTLVPSAEDFTLAFTLHMPDVSGMDLLKDPAAQKIVNEEELHSRTLLLKQSGLQGWEITDIAIHGKASDEKSSSPNGGMGYANSEMEPLAAQYGQFVRDKLIQEFTTENIPLKDDALTVTSGEAVLDTQAQLHWNVVREAAGYTSNEAFIKAYKANPETMPEQARALLKTYLDDNRGAKVTIALSRPTTKAVPVTKTTSVTRCVENTIIDQVTKSINHTYGGDLPFFPVLLPSFQIYRRREEEENATGLNLDIDQVPVATRQDPSAKVIMPITREVATEQLPDTTGAGNRAGLAVQAEKGRHRYIESTPRIKGSLRSDSPPEDYHNRWFASYRESRRRRRNGWIAAGLGATLLGGALYATTNLDAGYCPDPEKYADQPFDRNRGLPNTLHINFENPLTGDRTRSWLVFGANVCGDTAAQKTAVRQTDPNSSLPLTNTCDTRILYYRDGILIDVDESLPNPNSTDTKVVVSE